jgi:hypothetical protein
MGRRRHRVHRVVVEVQSAQPGHGVTQGHAVEDAVGVGDDQRAAGGPARPGHQAGQVLVVLDDADEKDHVGLREIVAGDVALREARPLGEARARGGLASQGEHGGRDVDPVHARAHGRGQQRDLPAAAPQIEHRLPFQPQPREEVLEQAHAADEGASAEEPVDDRVQRPAALQAEGPVVLGRELVEVVPRAVPVLAHVRRRPASPAPRPAGP